MNTIDHEELSRCLFEESNDAFFIFDPDDHRILDANPTAERLTGTRRKQLLGRRLPDILRADDAHTIEELIHAYQSTGVFHSKEGYCLRSAENGPLAVNVSVSRIHTTPKPLGLVVVRDISKRKEAEEALRLIVEGTSRTFGEDFFRSLVRHLATALEVRFAFVSEIHKDRAGRLRLLAHWEGNDFGKNFEYDIKRTPCEHVIEKGLAYYPENVQQLFPDDVWLKESGIESYLAISFTGPDGHPQGHLGVAHDKPMPNSRPAQSILRIFAARAGAELLRKRAEEALQQANDELEIRVEQRTAELEESNKELRSEIANRAQVEKRETQLGRIVEESLDEIFIFDAKTFRFVQANRGARENLGYSLQELSTMTPLDVKPRVTPEKFMEIAAPLLDGERKRVKFETVHRRKDGSLYDVEAHLQLAELDNKPVFVAFVRDITERKRAEEELRDSELRNRTLLESSPVCTEIVDLDSRLQYMSAAGREQLKISDIEPFYGCAFPPNVYPEPWKTLASEHLERAKSGETSSVDCCVLDTEGNELWYDTTFVPARNAEGRIEHVIVTSVNITERRRAEEALRQSEARFSAFMQHLPGIAFMKDTQGRHIFANAAFEKLLEVERDGWYLKTNNELFPSDVAAGFNEHDRTVMQEVRPLQTMELTGSAGEIRHWLTHRFPITDDEGIPVLLGGIAVDVTEQKQMEEQIQQNRNELAHVARLSTMGEMATGLAHELNQPLTAITSYCYLGEQALTHSESTDLNPLRELFEKLTEQAMRAGEIIRRLRALVGKRTAIRSPVDVVDPIQEVLHLMESDLRQREVRVELQADHSNGVAVMDDIQIQQVLVNLIRNALDAMSEIDCDQSALKITTSLTTDDLIEVAVCDTGKGVPLEKKDQIFDPFFTTKSEGMGLGLAISRTIIESHGGRLWMTTNSDRGVTFHFTLPIEKQ
ncbi:MAG: PAS domain S-box protein [Planctomycetes bacterium]|nr:PAS domain S-box protein [Planctomycetota bacterium]